MDNNIRIQEYENWSINNIGNCIDFTCGIGKGIIVLVSDKEINELEILGLQCIVQGKAEIYKGLDLNIDIVEGEYSKSNDTILSYESFHNIFEASSNLLSFQNKDLLNNSKDIICIFYELLPRYNKSKLWKIFNKRYYHINNWMINK